MAAPCVPSLMTSLGTPRRRMAVRGEDPIPVLHGAGRENFATTRPHVRAAEAIREGFGTVFSSLPNVLSRAAGPAVTPVIRWSVGRNVRSRPPHRERPAYRCGEGGIRTRGRLLTCARLASGYLRPLGHLS